MFSVANRATYLLDSFVRVLRVHLRACRWLVSLYLATAASDAFQLLLSSFVG